MIGRRHVDLNEIASPTRRWIVRTMVVAIVLAAIGISIPLAVRAWRAPSYESVAGTLTVRSPEEGVRYAYDLDGVRHTGDRVSLLPSSGRHHGVSLWESPAAAHRAVGRLFGDLAPGDPVTVWYRPDDPSDSALDVDVHPVGRWVMIAVPGVLAIVAVIVLLRR